MAKQPLSEVYHRLVRSILTYLNTSTTLQTYGRLPEARVACIVRFREPGIGNLRFPAKLSFEEWDFTPDTDVSLMLRYIHFIRHCQASKGTGSIYESYKTQPNKTRLTVVTKDPKNLGGIIYDKLGVFIRTSRLEFPNFLSRTASRGALARMEQLVSKNTEKRVRHLDRLWEKYPNDKTCRRVWRLLMRTLPLEFHLWDWFTLEIDYKPN